MWSPCFCLDRNYTLWSFSSSVFMRFLWTFSSFCFHTICMEIGRWCLGSHSLYMFHIQYHAMLRVGLSAYPTDYTNNLVPSWPWQTSWSLRPTATIGTSVDVLTTPWRIQYTSRIFLADQPGRQSTGDARMGTRSRSADVSYTTHRYMDAPTWHSGLQGLVPSAGLIIPIRSVLRIWGGGGVPNSTSTLSFITAKYFSPIRDTFALRCTPILTISWGSVFFIFGEYIFS